MLSFTVVYYCLSNYPPVLAVALKLVTTIFAPIVLLHVTGNISIIVWRLGL